MSEWRTPVTDRTKADVYFLEALRAKIRDETATPEEMYYWLYGSPAPLYCLDGPLECLDGPLYAGDGVIKGAYNAQDLNRVEGNTQHLMEILREYGYGVRASTKTDWKYTDIPRSADMGRYLGNVKSMADTYYTLPTSPKLPASMNKLTHEGANAIERVQEDMKIIIGYMEDGLRYCGTFSSGQGVILP